MKYYNYDHSKSWEDNKPGWYDISLLFKLKDCSDVLVKLSEIVEWIYKNIDNCEKHCRWLTMEDYPDELEFSVKFRYERDYIWFRLRWQ